MKIDLSVSLRQFVVFNQANSVTGSVELFGNIDQLKSGLQICRRTETMKYMKTFGVVIFECCPIRLVK